MTVEIALDTRRMAVDENGVQDFAWPVSRDEVLAVRQALLPPLVAAARGDAGADHESARLLSVVLLDFASEAMTLYQACLLSRRLAAAGTTLVPPQGSRVLPAVAAGRAPTPARIIDTLIAGPARTKHWGRVALGRMQSFVRWNGPSPGVVRPIDSRRDIVAIQRTRLIARHARATRQIVQFGDPLNWLYPLSRSWANGERRIAASADVIDAAISAANAGFRAGGEVLPAYLEDYLRDWLADATGLVRCHLSALVGTRRLPHQLWTGSGGSIWSRLIRHATLMTEGEVTGHDHGTGYGFLFQVLPAVIEFESCDVFVTFNEAQAAALRDSATRAELLVPPKGPKIIAVPGRSDSEGWMSSKSSRESRPTHGLQTVETVMYASSFYGGEVVRIFPNIADIVAVDWEARLFGKLRGWGYRALDKPHPSCTSLTPPGFSNGLGVRVLTERLEAVMEMADVIIFASPHSTAFANTLASHRPAVFVDFGLDNWVPQAYEMLGCQCKVVQGWSGEDNRLHVDWDELHAAIDEAPNLSDTAFADSYLVVGG